MDKRCTRVERTTAPGENRNNARGKPKSSFPKAGGSNSRRNQPKPPAPREEGKVDQYHLDSGETKSVLSVNRYTEFNLNSNNNDDNITDQTDQPTTITGNQWNY